MEKIWLTQYPSTVPPEINTEIFSSLVDLFESSVNAFRKAPALHHLGKTISYDLFEKKTRDFAAFLQQKLKLKKGDRFAIMLPNSMQYMIALFGALRAGLVIVNVNPLYTVREVEHQVHDAQATAIIVLSNFAHIVQAALPNTALQHVIVTDLGDMLGIVKSKMVNFTLKYVKKIIPPYDKKKVIALKWALREGRRIDFSPVSVQGCDLAFLQYTGGTTGVSKGAMLTHRNILSNVEQAYAWMAKDRVEPGKETIVTALPLYHIFSLTVNAFSFLKIGILNVLITNATDIAGFIRELSKHRITIFTGVNTLFKALLRHRKFKELDFKPLKIVIGGGMAVHRSVAEEWHRVTGTPLLEGYGLTEASPIVTCNPLEQTTYSGSIGLPVPSTEIKIVDSETGEELPQGEAGELCVRGPQVMQGYWNKPEETALVLTEDGWLKTGDIAKADDQGLFYIVDRKKDMIVVSGYNVYPNEVEAVLAEHPDVLEVAVIGESSEKTGEIIKAYIVRRTPNLDRAVLMNFCRERLISYKIPKRFEFCEELPKSNVGKILRRVLREERFKNKNIH